MFADQANAAPTYDFSRQIDYLRKLEPPNEIAFLYQVFLILAACFTTYFLIDWWECAVWSVAYVSMQLCEKLTVRLVPDSPSLPVYLLVLSVLVIEAAVYCFMAVYLWFLGPEVAKFGALAMITASTMHTMLHRAAFPSILMCFLGPVALVFAIISISAAMLHAPSDHSGVFVVAGLAICGFYMGTFFQMYRKEVGVRRVKEGRLSAEAAKTASEIRFKSLFESAPIPIREEDLSGMKRMVDQLGIPDSEAFGKYLDQNPEFLEACSKQIRVVDANNASLQQHGYTRKSEMLAKVVGTLSAEAKEIVRMTVETLHSGAPGRSYETKILRADGETRTVSATWSVIPGHEDTYSRILLCSVDMTEYLRSQEALRQAQKMEAVGQLTGGVAHDFNNLLTVIRGNIDLLEMETDADHELMSPIKKAVSRGAELTQRLLAFSRKQPLAPKIVDLEALVLEMRDLISRTLGDEIVVDLALADDLWTARADPGQIEAALLNMALNSRDAMPSGGKITISSHNMRIEADDVMDLDPGDYVVLSICDTGTGMTPDVLDRAFEPFFTTKEVGKGTGLGLPSIYGFAKQSGGDVHIQSALGLGTKVSLYLPRSQAVAEGKPSTSSPCKGVDGRGTSVLILEDNPDVQKYLSKLMTLNGFEVQTAATAADAQALIDDGQGFDLLISDVMLPGGVSGPEFAVDMQQTSPEASFLFISGRPSEARIDRFPSLSAATVLQKPFSRDELIRAVLDALKPQQD